MGGSPADLAGRVLPLAARVHDEDVAVGSGLVARPGTENPWLAGDAATPPVRRALTPSPQSAVHPIAPASGAGLNLSPVEVSSGLSAHDPDAAAVSAKQGHRRSDAG